MTQPSARAVVVLVAGLIGFGILTGCGSVDVDAYREPAETTAAVEAPTTRTPSAPATASGGGTDGGAAAEPATTRAPTQQETRAEILLLEGPQLDGQQFDLAATAGNDVLLWFWAPW